MKKILLTLALMLSFSLGASSQEIYNEVKRILQNEQSIKNDTTRNIEERKIATFKWDAIYYMLIKASDNKSFTSYDLGIQTSSMIDFVNLYVKRLQEAKKNQEKQIIKARFKNATTHNSLFNDMEKEIVYAYVDNEKFITQFSLDTDWVKALEEVRNNN